MGDAPPPAADDGRLAFNIMQFGRALRAAGLPVGTERILAALEAVRTVELGRRDDFYWALHAALVTHRNQREVFDQAFHIFWRNPDLLKRALRLLLPQVATGRAEPERPISRRVAEALKPDRRPGHGQSPPGTEPPEIELDATLTFSDRELLRHRDFEQMTAEEIARAKQAVARMKLPVPDIATRRFRADPAGPRIDLRRTLRASLRGGGAVIDLARRRRRMRPPPIVALCDISGSMSQYSRLLLHFLHAVSGDRERVHSFVFGTRLTNITRQLRYRDVDEALARVGNAVEDWSGGTRIGPALHRFNRDWSRRVLGQNAVVLLITDGLDRDSPELLTAEMDRLHRSCRRLIWLNPLLRYSAYAPKSMGARAILPHVDELRPVHSLSSLADLAQALDAETPVDRRRMTAWRALAMEEAA